MGLTSRTAWLGVIPLVVIGATPKLLAQEPRLADVAAQEAQRRQSVSQPSKVYTNADLPPVTSFRPPPLDVPSLPPVREPVSVQSTEPSTRDAETESRRSNFCQDCERDAAGNFRRRDAARRAFMQAETAEPAIKLIPVWQVPVIPVVLPPSCGVNTAREQAMSNFTRAAGFGGPETPLPPCPPVAAP